MILAGLVATLLAIFPAGAKAAEADGKFPNGCLKMNASEFMKTTLLYPNIIPESGGQVAGFKVGDIKKGGYGERLGLKPGDAILEWEGQKLNSPDQMLKAKAFEFEKKKSAKLKIDRDGKPQILTLNCPT